MNTEFNANRNGDSPISPIWMTQCGVDIYKPLVPGTRTGHERMFTGLTKREHFASVAMQGIMSNPEESQVDPSTVLKFLGLDEKPPYDFREHYPKYIAKLSVMYADALLKELEQ